jgi:hypothetical protein
LRRRWRFVDRRRGRCGRRGRGRGRRRRRSDVRLRRWLGCGLGCGLWRAYGHGATRLRALHACAAGPGRRRARCESRDLGRTPQPLRLRRRLLHYADRRADVSGRLGTGTSYRPRASQAEDARSDQRNAARSQASTHGAIRVVRRHRPRSACCGQRSGRGFTGVHLTRRLPRRTTSRMTPAAVRRSTASLALGGGMMGVHRTPHDQREERCPPSGRDDDFQPSMRQAQRFIRDHSHSGFSVTSRADRGAPQCRLVVPSVSRRRSRTPVSRRRQRPSSPSTPCA